MKEYNLDGHPALNIEFEAREGQKVADDWLAWDLAAFMRDHGLTRLEVYYGQKPPAEPVEKVGLRERMGLQPKAERVQDDSDDDTGDEPVERVGKSLLGAIEDEGDGTGTGTDKE